MADFIYSFRNQTLLVSCILLYQRTANRLARFYRMIRSKEAPSSFPAITLKDSIYPNTFCRPVMH